MVLPWLKIVWISDSKGYGLVADRDIPQGTITFVQDGLDIVLNQQQVDAMDPHLLAYVEKYSYEDYLGQLVISWDLGKYMNHDDEANTLTSGYGFEVAIKDIAKGEEVTDDYRIFSTHHNTADFMMKPEPDSWQPWPDQLLNQWNEKVKTALMASPQVDQPLMDFVEESVWKKICELKSSPEAYISVSNALPLRYKKRFPGENIGQK